MSVLLYVSHLQKASLYTEFLWQHQGAGERKLSHTTASHAFICISHVDLLAKPCHVSGPESVWEGTTGSHGEERGCRGG